MRTASRVGNTLVTSGANAKLHEVDAAGVEVWRLELPAGHFIYRAERVPTLVPDVPGDTDADGVVDDVDNCPVNANVDQEDCDCDGLGNVCSEALGLQGVCDPGCDGDPLWHVFISGIAQGGSVQITVSGELFDLTTTAGQTAKEVIESFVALINQSSVLGASGISASSSGGLLATDGTVDSVVLLDSGFSSTPPANSLPALSSVAMSMLVALLGTSGVALQRRR